MRRTMQWNRRTRAAAWALLAVILTGAPAVIAHAETSLNAVPVGGLLHDRAQILQGIAVVASDVYMLTQQSLYRWRPGEETARELTSAEPFAIDWENLLTPMLLSDGQAMWRFESDKGRLQRLTAEGDTYTASAPVQLDWRQFSADGGSPGRAAIADGTLWLIQEANGGTRLLRCAIRKGAKPQRARVRDVCALAAGPDGRLLALQQDMAGSDKRMQQGGEPLSPVLGWLDARGDAFAPIAALDAGRFPCALGAALLAAGDDFYVALNDRVWRVRKDGTQQACAVLPGLNFLNPDGAPLWPLGEDLLLAAGEQHVLIRSRHPEALAQSAQLRISQNVLVNPRLEAQVGVAMGDTALVVDGELRDSTQEELAAAFLLGQVHNDVLVLDDHAFDLAGLGAKGYLADLSGSAALRAYAEGLDPKLRHMLWQEGRLVMVPVRVGLQTPAAHADALGALGLPVPGDFMALCDLVERYAQGGMENAAPHSLLDAGSCRQALIQFGIGLYFQAAHAGGGEVSFDTPEFRQMMARAQGADQGAPGRARAEGEEGDGDGYPIMNLYATLDGFGWLRQEAEYARAFDFIAMSALPGRAPAVPASFTMLAVNSRTAQPERAIQYLEEVVKTIDPRTRALLTPGITGPLPNPDYAHDQAEDAQRLRMYEQIANNAASASTRGVYAREAEAVRLRLANRDTELKYLESADTVARARAIADHMQPQTALMNAQWLDALAEPVQQFAQGAIDLEQFIRGADSRLRLVTRERQ